VTPSILTVTVPAATHDLTTIETIKDELDITGTASDERLYRWISEASGFIENYCGRVFAAETLSEMWRGLSRHYANAGGRMPLILTRRPVFAITSVTVDGTALTADQYEMDPATGMLWRLSSDCRIHWCAAKITVVYTAGYPLLGGLPYGIETACIETIKHRLAARNRDPNLKMQEIPGELVQQWWVAGANEEGVPAEIRAMLDPHREISV